MVTGPLKGSDNAYSSNTVGEKTRDHGTAKARSSDAVGGLLAGDNGALTDKLAATTASAVKARSSDTASTATRSVRVPTTSATRR